MCAQIHTDFYIKFHYFCPIVTKLTVHISHISYSLTAFNVPYTHSLFLIYTMSEKFMYSEAEIPLLS